MCFYTAKKRDYALSVTFLLMQQHVKIPHRPGINPNKNKQQMPL